MDVLSLGVAIVTAIIAAFAAWYTFAQHQHAKRGVGNAVNVKDPPEDYFLVGYEWAEERYSYEALLGQLVGLDYASTPNLSPEAEGTPKRWASIFQKSRDTWRLIVNKDGMIVAYWSFFFPIDDVIERIRTGTFLEGSLSADDVLATSGPMTRPIFISMVVSHPTVEGNGQVIELMYSSIAKAIDDLANRGVMVTTIYSNAFTKKGYNASLSLGLQPGITDSYGNTLFTGEWNPLIRERLLQRAIRGKERATRKFGFGGAEAPVEGLRRALTILADMQDMWRLPAWWSDPLTPFSASHIPRSTFRVQGLISPRP